MKSIHIAGGDKRQVYLSEMLREKGYSVTVQGFETLGIPNDIRKADITFLPVPCCSPDGFIKAPFSNNKMTIEEVAVQQGQSFYVLGKCDDRVKKSLGSEIRCFDLLADESFLIDNAVLSAEGAVCAYQNYKKLSLCGARCVVVGYGRIAKQLCSMLKAYTGDITATARKEKDLALIRAAHFGCEHTKDLKRAVCNADVVFNTVPYHVFGKEELSAIKQDAVLIELASPPYGCDMELAQNLGVDVRIEAGIPGRYFPKSAAQAMMRAFKREENKEWN